MERQSLEYLLDQGVSVEQIAKRFGKDPSTVSYWMKKYGLVSPYREKHAARGEIGRERLEQLVESGLSIAAIADAVDRSKATVRHWLKRYGLKTRTRRQERLEEVIRPAKHAGRLTVTMTCPRHAETEFFLEGRGYYRCKRCRAERVTRRRRNVKAILVAEAGGRCIICGYDRHPCALEFHHLDRATKRLLGSERAATFALDTLREEAKMCVLLCSNCHAEVENGLVALPLRLPDNGVA